MPAADFQATSVQAGIQETLQFTCHLWQPGLVVIEHKRSQRTGSDLEHFIAQALAQEASA